MKKEYAYAKQELEKLFVLTNQLKISQVGDDQLCILNKTMGYYTFAGLLKAGILHRKETNDEGLDVIVFQLGDSEFSCLDVILKSVLKDEYDLYIKPYEDNSNSLLKFEFEEGAYQIENTPEKEKLDFSKVGTSLVKIKDSFQPKEPKTIKPPRIPKEKIPKLAKIQKIKQEEVFEYNPDYDHFYDSELPRLLDEVESIPGEIISNTMGIVFFIFVVIICFIFIL